MYPKPSSLWPASEPGSSWPPGRSRLPVIACNEMMHWLFCMPSVFWSTARPHMMAAGLALAYMRAASLM